MGINNFLITDKRLSDLLEKLISRTTVIAPVRNEFDDQLFLPIKATPDIYWGSGNTLNSPKEYFFPDSEVMFKFKNNRTYALKPYDDSEEIVLFNVKACDTKAIELLDKFYSRKFKDNFYFSRREKATILTFGCIEMDEQCFCTATKSGPFLEEGFDLQFVPLKHSFLVQTSSEKGDKFLSKYKQYFSEADDAVREEAKVVMLKARDEKPKFSLEQVYTNIKNKNVNSEIWQDIGQRCQSCGLCLFICPTCSCFAVNDRGTAQGESRRIRQWDADYFHGFTRMAGNNNPIKTREQMVQRKYYHKLVQQIDEFNMCGCVGCGRCNLCCVGEVNWLKNIMRIEGKSYNV